MTLKKVLTKIENQERGFIPRRSQEEKVLGVVWNYLTDEFSFKVKVDLPRLTDHSVPRLTDHSVDLGIKMVKRTLLSQVARFYDPIGFAAAFVIRAK